MRQEVEMDVSGIKDKKQTRIKKRMGSDWPLELLERKAGFWDP